MKKKTEFIWGKDQQKAFDTLILQYPNYEKKFILITDALGEGIKAVLSQKDKKGREIVIAYASRSLQGAEKRYPITELKCLAVIWE